MLPHTGCNQDVCSVNWQSVVIAEHVCMHSPPREQNRWSTQHAQLKENLVRAGGFFFEMRQEKRASWSPRLPKEISNCQ